MSLGYLTNKIGDAVPLLDRPFNSMAWYLPPKSAANRTANTTSQQMGPGIYGTFGSEIHGGSAAFTRIARHYEAVGGALADPEAAPNLTLTPGGGLASIDLSADYNLLLNGDTGRILVDHRPSDTQTPIWGQQTPQGVPQLWEDSWFGLDDGTAIAIETAPASDHADAFIPARIDLTRDGRTLTLQAAGPDA
ncbi:hypothetical protein U5A82_19420 [Sphingobium sp. CR2-8]|uniref:hypothetical protein n=1 Tax=Sphingobium sp. CR2-8 TaxID=1306534 RepID=UPI002DB6FCB0|nr:hypothetical protein [Sphingobium sp. CR2-8]MEC3912563.1 hypothetical protein [Sphingobium sp. CR2-8]